MNIFITGVSSGIGRELTKQLTSLDHQVWGLARRQKLLSDLQQQVGSKNFHYSVCDIADAASVAEAIKHIENRNFIPDVIILNAAIFPDDINPAYDHNLASQAFAINLTSTLRWVGYWLEKFKQNNKGHFIVISSTSAFRPSTRGIAYPASKAALAMAMRGFRLKYRQSNIKFSTIYFGPLASQMWEGKKNFLIPAPEQAAKHVINIIKTPKDQSYYPRMATLFFRLTRIIPDAVFAKLTQKIIK